MKDYGDLKVSLWNWQGGRPQPYEGLEQRINDELKKADIPATREMTRICLGLVADLLDREIGIQKQALAAERAQIEAEVAARLSVADDFVKIVKPLVQVLSLGPYDEISSVAVKRSDGEVEIISMTGGLDAPR